jgi:uncharacterized protein YggT (Ycf19 family)
VAVLLFLLGEAVGILYWLIILRWAMAVFRPSRPPRWFLAFEHWAEGMTEWLLRPLRRILPTAGNVDLAPMAAIVGLWLVQTILQHLAAGMR